MKIVLPFWLLPPDSWLLELFGFELRITDYGPRTQSEDCYVW